MCQRRSESALSRRLDLVLQGAVRGFGSFFRAPALDLVLRGSGTSIASPTVSRPLESRSCPLTAGFPRFSTAGNNMGCPS